MKIRLGYWNNSFSKALSYPTGGGHGLLCGPTRSGKLRDILCQILLSFHGSVFCIDPKGQAAAVTARYRQEVLGQDVYILNPFNILPDYLGKFLHAQFDPISSQLDPESDTFAADADNLMEGLLPHGGSEIHWIDSARLLSAGIGMHHRAFMDRWSLPDIYASICDSNLHQFCEDELVKLADHDSDSPLDENVEHIVSRLSRFRGEAANDNREIRSVVSTAITRLGFAANKPLARNMRKSTVSFRAMRHRPITVYVIPDARYLGPCSVWTRMITNSFADACLEAGGADVPVLGILQEFKTAVGNLTSVNTLNALGAGYGCQLLYEIHDLNELQEMMPQGWQTFLGSSAFQIFLPPGPGDLITSEHVSKMTGMKEIHGGSQSFGERQANVSVGSQARRYLLPEEVREIPEDEMLVWISGVRGVIRAGRRPYYQSPEFDGKYDEDPFHAKKKPD